MPSYEQTLFAQFHNIVEDPRIEYFADQFVGGNLLASLEFAIAHTYKIAKPLDESQGALGQYLNALIMFGDNGLLKGRFSFPEAKEAFVKTAPLFDAAVREPSARKAMKIVKEIFEIARPLCQDEVNNAKMLEELMKDLDKQGKSASSGSGKPSGTPGEGEDSDKTNARQMTRNE